jgi:hypothetical protein
MKHKYEIIIYWCNEDQAFIAEAGKGRRWGEAQ